MEQATKIRILIFVGIGLAIISCVILFVNASGKKEKREEIVIRSDAKSNFTLQDMMGVNEKNNPQRYSKGGSLVDDPYQDDEEVKRLRELLRQQKTEEPEPARPIVKPKEKKEVPKEQQPEPEAEPVVQKTRRFFSATEAKNEGNVTTAVVHGEQEVKDGSTLKLRLLSDVTTKNGQVIPKNTYLYGVVSIAKERIKISIETVLVANSIYTIEKQVYDIDGLPGIYVPGNIGSELSKELAEDVADEIRSPYSRDIISQGISALSSASKTVFRKNNRIVKVTVKSNYTVYLK